MLEIEDHEAITKYQELYAKMLAQAESEDMVPIESLMTDCSNYPFVVNVVNPFKHKYFGPACRLCGQKQCKNCPLPISQQTTLRELLDQVKHLTKFERNDNLFKNYETLKEEESNSDDDDKIKSNKPNKPWYST